MSIKEEPASEAKRERKKLRDGFVGAIIGGSTAYMLMSAFGEVSVAILVLITAFSFLASYQVGEAALTWLAKLDEYDP